MDTIKCPLCGSLAGISEIQGEIYVSCFYCHETYCKYESNILKDVKSDVKKQFPDGKTSP